MGGQPSTGLIYCYVRRICTACTLAPPAENPQDSQSVMVNERRYRPDPRPCTSIGSTGYSLVDALWEAPDGAHYHSAWYLHYKKTYATPGQKIMKLINRVCSIIWCMGTDAIDKINLALTACHFQSEYKYTIRHPVRRFDWNGRELSFFVAAYAFTLDQYVLSVASRYG